MPLVVKHNLINQMHSAIKYYANNKGGQNQFLMR